MRLEFESSAVLSDDALDLVRHAIGNVGFDFDRDAKLGPWQRRKVHNHLIGELSNITAGPVRIDVHSREEAPRGSLGYGLGSFRIGKCRPWPRGRTQNGQGASKWHSG